jgi:hypothetical protein
MNDWYPESVRPCFWACFFISLAWRALHCMQ